MTGGWPEWQWITFITSPTTLYKNKPDSYLVSNSSVQPVLEMNIDRRIIGGGHGPSDDSGSDGEENLRVSKFMKTFEQVFEDGSTSGDGGISLKWPVSVSKVIPERIKHSKINVL